MIYMLYPMREKREEEKEQVFLSFLHIEYQIRILIYRININTPWDTFAIISRLKEITHWQDISDNESAFHKTRSTISKGVRELYIVIS